MPRGRPKKADADRKRDKPRVVLHLTDSIRLDFEAARAVVRRRLGLEEDAYVSDAAVLEEAVRELGGG